MPLTRQKKESIIKDFHKKAEEARIIVFLNFHGIGVGDINALRKEMKNIGCGFQVIKKTLLERVLDGFGFSGNTPALDGELAVSVCSDEGMGLARILVNASKKLKGLKILGGVFDKRYVEQAAINYLASIPSREVLLGQFIGVSSSPLSRMVGVLKGEMISLVSLLDQISKKSS